MWCGGHGRARFVSGSCRGLHFSGSATSRLRGKEVHTGSMPDIAPSLRRHDDRLLTNNFKKTT